MQKKLHSLILKYFSPDVLIELGQLSNNHNIKNNQKGKLIMDLLRNNNIPAQPLGSGTNRYGVILDGYSLKIALDKLGRVDNRREFKYSLLLYPDVLKVYESTPDGLIAVSEYINTFVEPSEMYAHQDEMREILSRLSQTFLIGDIGITTKNYANWGTRFDGSLTIMDFAYIYTLSFKAFQCQSCGETLEYDDDFVDFKCPNCRKKFTFGEIRRRISKSEEENEIGDITKQGYVLSSIIEEHDVVKEFELEVQTIIKKTKKNKNVIIKDESLNYDLTPEEQFQLMKEERNIEMGKKTKDLYDLTSEEQMAIMMGNIVIEEEPAPQLNNFNDVINNFVSNLPSVSEDVVNIIPNIKIYFNNELKILTICDNKHSSISMCLNDLDEYDGDEKNLYEYDTIHGITKSVMSSVMSSFDPDYVEDTEEFNKILNGIVEYDEDKFIISAKDNKSAIYYIGDEYIDLFVDAIEYCMSNQTIFDFLNNIYNMASYLNQSITFDKRKGYQQSEDILKMLMSDEKTIVSENVSDCLDISQICTKYNNSYYELLDIIEDVSIACDDESEDSENNCDDIVEDTEVDNNIYPVRRDSSNGVTFITPSTIDDAMDLINL